MSHFLEEMYHHYFLKNFKVALFFLTFYQLCLKYLLIIHDIKSLKIRNFIHIRKISKVMDHNLPSRKRARWWEIFDIIYLYDSIMRVQYFFSEIKIYVSHITSYNDQIHRRKKNKAKKENL